jgi:hypothetical protein
MAAVWPLDWVLLYLETMPDERELRQPDALRDRATDSSAGAAHGPADVIYQASRRR